MTSNRTRKRARWVAPFWNARQNRIRAFWRILGALVVVLPASILLGQTLIQSLDTPFAITNLVSNAIPAAITLGVAAVWAKYIDKRPFRAYGVGLDSAWWRMLVVGVLVGVLGWGGALATDLALGWARITDVFAAGSGELSFPVSMLVFIAGWLFVGFWEELLFRGIVMRNAIEGFNHAAVSYRTAVIGGLAVSSGFFAVLHLDQATSVLALLFWVMAGLVFGLAYLLTDELAYPIGLHFAFDFSFNNVFGLAAVRDLGTELPSIIRPAFGASETLVGLSGAVNTVWLFIIGALTVGVIRWRYGSLEVRLKPYEP